MKKILKHYVKSFFKSITSSLSALIYLFVLFLLVFSFSVYSIQNFNNYLPFLTQSSFWKNNINPYYGTYNFDKFENKANNAAYYFDNLKANYIVDQKKGNSNFVFDSQNWWKIILEQVFINHNQNSLPAQQWNNLNQVIANLENGASLGIQEKKITKLFQNQFSKMLVSIYIDGNSAKNSFDFFNYQLIDSNQAQFIGVKEQKVKNLFKNPNESFFDLLKNNKFNLTLLFFPSLETKINSFGFGPQFFFQDLISANSKNVDSSKNYLFIDATNNHRNKYNKIITSKKNLALLNDPSNNHDILVNKKFLLDNNLKINQKIYLFNSLSVLRKNHISNQNWPLLYQQFKIIGIAKNFSSSASLLTTNFLADNKNKNTIYGNIYLDSRDYFSLCQEVLNNCLIYNDAGEFNFTGQKKIAPIFKTTFLSLSNTNVLTSLNNNFVNNIIDSFLKQKIIASSFLNQKLFYSFYNTKAYSKYNSSITTIIIDFVFICFSFTIAFVFITFIIKKDITTSKRMIGIFKSLGYYRRQIAWVYSFRTLLSFIITSVLGFVASIPLQTTLINFYNSNNTSLFYFSKIITTWWFLIFIFIFIPLIFTLISFCINNIFLNKKPTWLLYNSVDLKSIKVLKVVKKLFVKSSFYTRVQVSYTVQNFVKWIPILIIFTLAIMILIIETAFSTAVFKNAYYLLLQDIYSNKINTVYTYNLNSQDETTKINNQNKFKTIFAKNQFVLKNNAFLKKNKSVAKSLNFWEKNKNNPLILLTSLDLKIDPYVKISTWNYILNQKLISAKIPKQIKDIFAEIAKNNPLKNNLIISFNKLFFNPHKEIKVFETYLESNYFTNFNLNSQNTFPIFGVNSINDLNFGFEHDNLKINNSIKKMFNKTSVLKENNYLTIPVIIPKLLAKNLNVKINQEIYYSSLNNKINLLSCQNQENAKRISNIKLKIVGILPKNIYGKYFITSYQELARYYVDKNNASFENFDPKNNANFGLDNQVFSTINTFPKLKYLQDTGIKFNKTKFNVYYLPMYNSFQKSFFNPKTPLPLYIFLKDFKNSYFSPQFPINFNKSGNQVIYIPQVKNTISKIDAQFFIIQEIQLVYVFFMIGLLLITCMNVVIEENTYTITLLKAIGYKGYQVNWLIVGNYFFAIILAAILSILLAHFFLIFINYLIYSLTSFLLPLNINYRYYFLILTFSLITIITCFLVTLKTINNKSITTQLD